MQIKVNDTKGGRFYLIDDKEYVSVTTPLSIISMPYLEIWKARKGAKVAEAISKKAAAHGTTIHGYIEDICKGKLPDIHPKHKVQMEVFQDWFNRRVKKIIASEKVVWNTKYGVAGKLDFIGEIEGYDGYTLLDWKTGRVDKKHFLQMAAYIHCVPSAIKKIKLTDIKHRLVISVRDDKVLEIPVDKKDPTVDSTIDYDWNVFLSLLTVYNWVKERK